MNANTESPHPQRDAHAAEPDHLGYLLTAYLFDNLSPAGKAEVEAHLESCPGCRAQLESLRATLLLTETVFHDEGRTTVFEERRRQRILDAAARSRHNFFARIDPAFGLRNWKALAAVAAILLVTVSVGVSALFAPGAKSVAYLRSNSDTAAASATKAMAEAQERYARTDYNSEGRLEYKPADSQNPASRTYTWNMPPQNAPAQTAPAKDDVNAVSSLAGAVSDPQPQSFRFNGAEKKDPFGAVNGVDNFFGVQAPDVAGAARQPASMPPPPVATPAPAPVGAIVAGKSLQDVPASGSGGVVEKPTGGGGVDGPPLNGFIAKHNDAKAPSGPSHEQVQARAKVYRESLAEARDKLAELDDAEDKLEQTLSAAEPALSSPEQKLKERLRQRPGESDGELKELEQRAEGVVLKKDELKRDPRTRDRAETLNRMESEHDSPPPADSSEVAKLKAENEKLARENADLETDLSRQTRRINTLIEKGVPVLSLEIAPKKPAESDVLLGDKGDVRQLGASTGLFPTGGAPGTSAEQKQQGQSAPSQPVHQRVAGEDATERAKVAIAAKDDTIRGKEELLAKERAEKDSLSAAQAQPAGGDSPPSDTKAREQSDVIVPPDVLARAELGDHFETFSADTKKDAPKAGKPIARALREREEQRQFWDLELNKRLSQAEPSATEELAVENRPVELGRRFGVKVGTTELLAERDKQTQIEGALYHRGRSEKENAGDETVLFDAKGTRLHNRDDKAPNRNDSLYLEYPKGGAVALADHDADGAVKPQDTAAGRKDGKSAEVANVELYIHDVRDLTRDIQDFPGPRIELGTVLAQSGADQPAKGPAAGGRGVDSAKLVEHLKDRFAYDFTDPNTAIEESGGKIVLMNTPEVKQKIAGYLGELQKDPETLKQNMHNTRMLRVMLDQTKNHWDAGRWKEAAEMAQSVLEKDPANPEANSVLALVREQRGEQLQGEQKYFFDLNRERAERMNIPHSDYLVYPEDWHEIAKRSAQGGDPRAFSNQWYSNAFASPGQQGVAPVQRVRQAQLERTLRAYNFIRSESNASMALSFAEFARRPAPVAPPALTDEGLDEDAYIEKYGTRPYVDAARDHLSTFGMDVDTASYARARSQLREDKLPDPAAVRVEEFVNYFKQPYSVAGEEAFGVFAEAAPSPFQRTNPDGAAPLQVLKIGIKSRDPKPGERKPAMLTFAIDTSGSMTRDDRLDMLRAALGELVSKLQPEDAVSIVAFSDQAQVLLPRTQARQRQRILDAIGALQSNGGTNVEAGLALAYRIADESYSPDAVNRVILCSDGVANVGAKGPDAVLKTVKVFAGRGIDLSSVGFGMGKYNDEMMVKLADSGNGSCHFVDSLDEARRIFSEQLPPHLSALARDAKVQVEFNPKVVQRYRLLGYEKRKIADKDFRNDAIDAGEVQHSTLVTALYELQRVPAARGPLGKVFLRWKDAGHRHLPVIERNFPLDENIQAASVEGSSAQLRFLACVARFAELLRGSPWVRHSSYADVLEELERLPAEFKQGAEWKEVQELVSRAQRLSVKAWVQNL